MSMPQRIQRKRTKGWNMKDASPNGRKVVYVGRPTKWGNPYLPGTPNPITAGRYYMTVNDTVRLFELYAVDRLQKEPHWLDDLRGHDLACYCRPSKPCHAEVLLRLANQGE